MKELDPSIGEIRLLTQALKLSLRMDGRKPFETRPVKISFPGALGQVEIQMGKTRILAQTSCQVVQPRPDRPYEGFLNINAEISPMASPAFETNRPSQEEVLINRLLEKSIRRSRAVDTEALCIISGDKVWSIRIDLHFLDHDGNLADCASIACIAALLHFRKPEVTVIGDEVIIHSVEDRIPTPLSIHHIPISVTFALFKEGPVIIMDPTKLEEKACDGTMTITLNRHQELCALSKDGGVSLDGMQIMHCNKLALTKVIEITEMMQKAIEEHSPKEEKLF